jgi:hypothetical protein
VKNAFKVELSSTFDISSEQDDPTNDFISEKILVYNEKKGMMKQGMKIKETGKLCYKLGELR